MRTVMRIGLALLLALGLSSSAFAQEAGSRFSANALVGPAFGTVGTTFSTVGEVSLKLTDAFSLGGEAGILPRAPFGDADEIAPPVTPDLGRDPRVNAYHWNANVRLQPFTIGKAAPYVTAGAGSFTADVLGTSRQANGTWIQDRRRATDFATNVGVGAMYRANRLLGIGADYRTFFVHRDADTPRVHRLTTGLSLFLK